MDDPFNLSMFRAYDIRTPSSQLTPALAVRLAKAEAVYVRDVLGVSGVVVAHDARRTGPQYVTVLTEILCDAGLEVIYLPGICSTSYFYYAAMRHPGHAGIMVGASHNPADDTGQKILAAGVQPVAQGIGPAGGLDKIKELYTSQASCRAERRGRIYACDLMDDYVQYSMNLAAVDRGALRGTHLLHDYLFGAAGREMMLGFGRAGAELAPLHFVPDGGFPLGDPNPVKQTVIREGLQTLRSGAFRFGAFFDGDGDRIDIYGGDGAYLSSSLVYAAILPEIRRRFPGDDLGVFADLKCNPLAVIEMAKTGVTVDVIRNGHSQIKKSLMDDGTRFGAVEESAHFYEAFRIQGEDRFCTENTLYIALLVARVWNEDPDRFEEHFRRQQVAVREREWGYKFPSDQQRAAALEAVRDHFLGQGAQSMERMKNGLDLEATLMRRGLPFDVDRDTELADDWLQVCQRVSQSETGLARWEVIGASAQSVRDAKRVIERFAAEMGAGEEYQG